MDQTMRDRVQRCAGDMFRQYYCCGDVREAAVGLAPEAVVIGVGNEQYFNDLTQTLDYFGKTDVSKPCWIGDEYYDIRELGKGLYLCTGTLTAMLAGKCLPVRASERLRFTMLFQQRGEELVCLHVHCSYPNGIEGARRDTSRAYLEQKASLELEQREHQMRVVLDAIQGGIKISRDDVTYSYQYVSEEVCAMFGYGMKEFLKASRGSAVGLVYPPDLPRTLAKVEEQFTHGSDYAVKYRVRCRDGSLKWIIDSGRKTRDEAGRVIINSLYLDVTDLEEANLRIARQTEELDRERQRFRIAIENAPTVIFEYDPAQDRYMGYGTPEKGADKHQIERAFPHFLRDYAAAMVEPENLERYRSLLRGEGGKELELRIAPYTGSAEFVWARITVTPQFKPLGGIDRIIGKMTNIQSEKEKEFALEEAKNKDRLTGLYAKEAGTRLVQRYLERKRPEEVCALMLLDLDDFKAINAEEGSAFADALLQEVAALLRAETQPGDILVRLGGDEFMLLVRNCNKSQAMVIGPRIAQGIQGLFAAGNRRALLSASIGMCVTAVVDEYAGLYRCAESTLKYVKENDRGRAACYLDTSNELGVLLTQLYRGSHDLTVIDHTDAQEAQDLISFALDLLGKAKNLDDAVALLLLRIGRRCGIDRISVLEMDRDYLSARFVYQWARNPGDVELGRRVYLNGAELDEMVAGYDEQGVCDRYAMAVMHGEMQSCLHAAMWNQGQYAGALCFEMRARNYNWSQEERQLAAELARIISSFLLKARADAVSQAKTDFLSRMSHEIRTPMNAITGMTQIAKASLDDQERTLDCLHKIEAANAYLLNLINDILDMNRIESGKMEPHYETMNLDKLMAELDALMRPQAESKGVALRLENAFAGGRPLVGDALRLNQVLVNMVGNAIKFTQAGSVTLGVAIIQENCEGISLRFSVRDTGIGIRREDQARIFNAFEQAGRDTSIKYGGTGLGLTISYRLVQMMGGTLEVKSEPGWGSEFYFTLPLDYAPDEEKAAPPVFAAPPDLKGKRLLVVEDNELNREIAEELLRMHGFVTEAARDGREALERFVGQEPGYYDGILMDIRMPVMDGLEATKRIRTSGRADARSVPIIAMSANAFDEDTKASMESGMDGHLAKPIEMGTLLALLAQCLCAEQEAGENRRI